MIKQHIASLGVLCLLAAPIAYAAETRDIEFPVDGTSSFRDDFHEPRGSDGQREHLGIDIIAAKMTPIVAAVNGTVTSVVIPEASWGYSITIQDSDGYQYRYLHINNDTPGTDDGDGGTENAYASGIRRGAKVKKGQLIAWVGDSGNAEATVSHLHFEIRQDNRSHTPINPYESLVMAAQESEHAENIRVGAAPVATHTSEGDIGVELDPTAPITQDLAEGSTGAAVRQLQTKLKALGFFTSYVTDYFGPITKAAVINFQKANGLTADGVVGLQTRQVLNGEKITPVEEQPSPSATSLFTQTLALNSQGQEVLLLQLTLAKLGYFQATATGYFGPITQAAVINFQKAKGIDPIGIVGPKTRAVLNAL